MKLKLREIEIFRGGELQPVDNHQRPASCGLRPRRLARFARPKTLRVLPTRHPPQTNAPTAHKLRAAKRRAPPAHQPDHPPQPSEQAETPHCSPMRARGKDGATGEGPLAR